MDGIGLLIIGQTFKIGNNMAGIWERVHTQGGESQVRVNVSLLRTELMGLALGVRTRADARVNLEAEMGEVFTAPELVDLNLLADIFETGNVEAKLVYAHKVDFALNEGELNLIDEATFRSVLGI